MTAGTGGTVEERARSVSRASRPRRLYTHKIVRSRKPVDSVTCQRKPKADATARPPNVFHRVAVNELIFNQHDLSMIVRLRIKMHHLFY
jgi:hypothetical protein